MSLSPIQPHAYAPVQPIEPIQKVQKQPNPITADLKIDPNPEGGKLSRAERLKRNKEILNKGLIESMRVIMQNHSRRMQEIQQEAKEAWERT